MSQAGGKPRPTWSKSRCCCRHLPTTLIALKGLRAPALEHGRVASVGLHWVALRIQVPTCSSSSWAGVETGSLELGLRPQPNFSTDVGFFFPSTTCGSGSHLPSSGFPRAMGGRRI